MSLKRLTPDILPTNISTNDIEIQPLEFVVNVVSEPTLRKPVITKLTYPRIITGGDFLGYDVAFELSWESLDASYVKMFIGETNETQLQANGSVLLNVRDVINIASIDVSSNSNEVYLPIKIVAYNVGNGTVRTGDVETLNIQFNKGNNTIPNNVVVNRIVEGFLEQLNDCEFDDSRYLTHLLHTGNGNNKVITTWAGLVDEVNTLNDSLIVKLYEPIGDDVSVNDKVWISKVKSETILETFTLSGESIEYCPPLKGANFSLLPDNGIGYQVFEDFATNDVATTNQIYQKYFNSELVNTSNLNVEFVSGSSFLFENFVHFSSAAERVKNFWYKVQLLESYQAKYNAIASSQIVLPYIATESGLILTTESDLLLERESIANSLSGDVVSLLELEKYINSINSLIGSFDAFETFLFKSDNVLAYPKESYTYSSMKPATFPYNGNVIIGSNTESAVNWYDTTLSAAELFDKYNVNYLNNNIPNFITKNYENEEFMLFLDMVGHHFDVIWLYIKSLEKLRKVNTHKKVGIPTDLIQHLLKSFGWDVDSSFNSHFLWEYALGLTKDGVQKYNILADQYSLKEANAEVWRRILNNLPYLLKHTGTSRAIKAAMACYGVPQSMLTIMEFGAERESDLDYNNFTFEDVGYALKFSSGSYVNNEWKSVNGKYPNAVEVRFKTKYPLDQTIIEVPERWGVKIKRVSDTYGSIELHVSNSLQTTLYTSSLDTMRLFDGEYKHLLLNHSATVDGDDFQLYIGEPARSRFSIYQSSSVLDVNENTSWNVSSIVEIGKYFSGSVDEFRLWGTELNESVFESHVLMPEAINGNSYTASSDDLWLRYDFGYPANVYSDNSIKNVALSSLYGVESGSAVNFLSETTYPYQFEVFDRTVTARVPSVGFSYTNKIRQEDQELISDLSHRNRATRKAFDRVTTDSSKLGFFFSPTKELNLDIIKSIGAIRIDNYIGDPMYEYSDEYKELNTLKDYYFERINRDIYEYIRLVKSIDRSLFDVIDKLTPARAKVASGLLIEPHILERSKVKWTKPSGDTSGFVGSFDVDNAVNAVGDVADISANVDGNLVVGTFGEHVEYNGNINAYTDADVSSSLINYDGIVDAAPTIAFSYENQYFDGSADLGLYNGGRLFLDKNVYFTVGVDENSIENKGFGIYAENGYALYREYDNYGNISEAKKLITINTIRLLETTLMGTNENYTNELVYRNDNIVRVSILPSGSSIPTPPSETIASELITDISLLNGYLPTHYKFTNNLSEGLRRSYYKGSVQTDDTTPDGLPAVQIFATNPNIIRVFETPRFDDTTIIDIE